MRMARRLEAMGQPKYAGTTRISGGRPKWNGVVRVDEAALELPATWKTGRMIFVNSMSDLFHEAVPLPFIQRVFATMADTPQHTYQILTKRADRLEDVSARLSWPVNVWMGVSVESSDYLERIDYLRRTGAGVKFLSLEPLLGPLERLDCTHPTKTACKCDLPLMVVQAAAALFCGWFAFQFQGSRSAILLAG